MVPSLSRALLIAAVVPLLLAVTPGSGSGVGDLNLCLLAPHADTEAGGRVRALLPLARPTIFVADPLAEVRLEQGGRRLWVRQAALLEPIQGPLPWPLPPLRPGERMLLQLRPMGEPENHVATIELQAGAAEVLARNEALRATLGSNGDLWLRAVEQALARRDAALAAALLFAFEGPSTPALDSLRRTAYAQDCRTTGSASVDTGPSPAP
ncbi:hypothetical protein NZK32_05300 [Cyanobium sp. FGCU-52]|nr:hypothetical protein [Cyanobium sp. FGCU52]